MDARRRALLLGLAASAVARGAAAVEPTIRAIPASGERLPVIGLGTWQTFDVGGGDRAPLREVLKQLMAKSVVDSSPMYGTSESVAGDLIAELKLREKLFVATKVWTQG